MRNILFTTMLLAAAAASSQTVSGVPLTEIKEEYIEVYADPKAFSSKVNLCIDFGQPTRPLSGPNEINLKGDDGKPMPFNSMVHAINFMASYGYEVTAVYQSRIKEEQYENRYVLRKGDVKE